MSETRKSASPVLTISIFLPHTAIRAMNKRVIVIGAGAGGMMEAGRAAESDADALLLEKKEHPGKKILITGNGRCNLTNARELDSFITQYGANRSFLRNVFSQFFRDDLLAFLNRYGVETKTEPNAQVFPASDNARNIVRVFELYMADNNVRVQTGVGVTKVLVENKRTRSIP